MAKQETLLDLLTHADLLWLDTHRVSEDVQVDHPRAGGPSAIAEATVNPLLIKSLLVRARLSSETRRAEEVRLATLERKKASLRKRKPYKRKVGTVHPKKKAATKRRAYAKKWAQHPFSCVLSTYGCKRLDRVLWDQYVAPLWERYDPVDLSVKFYRGYGTKDRPFTIYTLDVLYSGQVVYSGRDREIFDLSGGA